MFPHSFGGCLFCCKRFSRFFKCMTEGPMADVVKKRRELCDFRSVLVKLAWYSTEIDLSFNYSN